MQHRSADARNVTYKEEDLQWVPVNLLSRPSLHKQIISPQFVGLELTLTGTVSFFMIILIGKLEVTLWKISGS